MNRPEGTCTSTSRERRLCQIIEFAQQLQSQLCQPSDPSSPGLFLAEINNQLSEIAGHFQKPMVSIPPKRARELERLGRELWNLCIRLRRDDARGTASGLLIRARLFAFYILEQGRRDANGKIDAESDIVYLMNLALTLGRLCLEEGDVDSARMALQRVAEYVERMDGFSSKDEEERVRLQAGYFAMRMALSWKENRLDVAEHMYRKTGTMRSRIDVEAAEAMADTLRHIGADLLAKGDFVMARKWLERGYRAMNDQNLEKISAQGLDTRLAIFQGLVQSLLGTESPESLSEAGNLIDSMQSEIGDKPLILHLRLEILQRSPPELFEVDSYASILRQMVRVFDFSDVTLRFILHHIQELHSKSSRLACSLLDELLLQKLVTSKNSQWMDKAVVRRVWMGTIETAMSNCVVYKGLVSILDGIYEANSKQLGPDATGAAHSLIWAKVDAAMTRNQYQMADVWCKAALHNIFSSSGELTKAKFGRKRILCALGLNDADTAREVFASMSEATQNEPLTRYLMFKVSLLVWDHDLGCESIDCLSRSEDCHDSQEMLYACIREAQRVGDKLCTLAALKAVAARLKTGPTESLRNLPSILRCSIRLVRMVEEEDQEKNNTERGAVFAEDLCQIFETAAKYADDEAKDMDGKKIFTVPELNWFRKNAYNLGVTRCSNWDLILIIRIFETCLTFTSKLPTDLPLEDVENQSLMSMRCHFIISAALIAIARAEDRVDERLQRYLELRRHVNVFEDQLETKAGRQADEVIGDLSEKMGAMLVFDFEAAVVLKSWEDLGRIVRRAGICRDENILKAMGDCLLRSEAPGKVMFKTVRLIINDIFELEQFDSGKLAKYIRCIFQVILPLDDTLALQLLDEALKLAQEGQNADSLFPPLELEWLIATTFNHAIDYYAQREEERCHQWALKAMDLATHMPDNGNMEALLQEKFAKLQFSMP